PRQSSKTSKKVPRLARDDEITIGFTLHPPLFTLHSSPPQDLLNRGRQVLRHCPTRRLRCACLFPPCSREHQDPTAGEPRGCLEVAEPVADPVARRKVEPEAIGGLLIKERAGLAALALASDLGKVGTIVLRRDP